MKKMILTNNKTGINQELQVIEAREHKDIITLTYIAKYGMDEITVNKENTTIKLVENKKDIVSNILTLREFLKELFHQNKIDYTDYQAYTSQVGFKGTNGNTKVWLMRKTKEELNNIFNGLNKTLMKFN